MAKTSPCVQICKVNAAGYCIGCKRSLAEITHWSRLSEAEAAAIMAQLLERKIEGGEIASPPSKS